MHDWANVAELTKTKTLTGGLVARCAPGLPFLLEEGLEVELLEQCVASMAKTAEEAGVDRIAAWTYRGGHGTVVGAPDALKLWDTIGENYKRILKK